MARSLARTLAQRDARWVSRVAVVAVFSVALLITATMLGRPD